MMPLIVTAKLVAAVLADTTGSTAKEVKVELQVTPSFVPRLSSDCTKSWLLAVTAVVLTVSVGLVPVGTETLPAAAEPQTAGEALLEQFAAVASAPTVVVCGPRSFWPPSTVMALLVTEPAVGAKMCSTPTLGTAPESTVGGFKVNVYAGCVVVAC